MRVFELYDGSEMEYHTFTRDVMGRRGEEVRRAALREGYEQVRVNRDGSVTFRKKSVEKF